MTNPSKSVHSPRSSTFNFFLGSQIQDLLSLGTPYFWVFSVFITLPIIHLIYPEKFYITIVSNLSWSKGWLSFPKASRKVNGKWWLFGRFRGKFPGETECQNRWSCFPGWNKKIIQNGKFEFHFFKAIFDTRFSLMCPFFCKCNWLAQMVNAIPGWNLPVLDFAYHLPKARTDWFAHINGS